MLWTLFLLLWACTGGRAIAGLRATISPIFGEMRGKLGGNVFSRNKGGPYVRMHAIPTNPNSTRQQATRAWLATCAAQWKTVLGDTERGQWNEFAETHSVLNSLGQTIFLTGLDWFCKCNSRLLDAGGTPITEPTDLAVPEAPLTLGIAVASATTLTVTYTAALPADHFFVLWGSGPISAGQNPNFRQCRLIGYSPADQESPWTATMPWTLADGQDVKVYGAIMSAEGRVSAMLDARATYTAA